MLHSGQNEQDSIRTKRVVILFSFLRWKCVLHEPNSRHNSDKISKCLSSPIFLPVFAISVVMQTAIECTYHMHCVLFKFWCWGIKCERNENHSLLFEIWFLPTVWSHSSCKLMPRCRNVPFSSKGWDKWLAVNEIRFDEGVAKRVDDGYNEKGNEHVSLRWGINLFLSENVLSYLSNKATKTSSFA